MSIKLFFNGFWDGFIDGSNPVHVRFFLNLFEDVFGCPITISYDFAAADCDVLVESIFGNSILKHKEWKYSFLFSGESRLCPHYKDYTCVLWGERNYGNIVNLPLFITYAYCNQIVSFPAVSQMPSKNICAILSNSNGKERNVFMEKLEKLIPIDYAGSYKTNVGILKDQYHTEGFSQFVSQYKFIITMENSREDTYITEKIMHGFSAGIIPIYWGSNRVCDYFNKDRFIHVEKLDIDMDIDGEVMRVFEQINYLSQHPEEYLKMVQEPVYSANNRTIRDIARDIRNLIFAKPWQNISQIYIVSNPEFEPARYAHLCDMFYNKLGFTSDCVSFISPTYKHILTEMDMKKNVTAPIIHKLRPLPMKPAEVSLFLNYKAVLENIERNYKDGLFFIFESDIIFGRDITRMNDFIHSIYQKEWNLIHIGMYDNRVWASPNFKTNTGYDDRIFYNNDQYIEDITVPNDEFRLSRKFFTRCTDSFIWKYESIVLFLMYMNVENNYGVPFDYYMCNFFEKNPHFKHYWSENEFFMQGSGTGFFESTIQI
jgi:hypothetical protein